MWSWPEVELYARSVSALSTIQEGTTHREDAIPEHDDVHVQWLEVRRAVRVLVETTETDEVVIAEQLNLLARLLHLDIFRRQRVNRKHLWRSTAILAHEIREGRYEAHI